MPPIVRRIVVCCVLVVPAVVASACSREPMPIGFGVPSVRFETSESHGAGRGFLGVALGKTPRAVMVNDSVTEPPDTNRRVAGGRVET